MQSTTQSLLTIALASACTFATRLFPFALFGKRRVPQKVIYLGRVLPPAAIAVLIIYCLKDTLPLSFISVLPQLLAMVVVLVLHRWKKNHFLSIGVGTTFYMVLIRTVFQ